MNGEKRLNIYSAHRHLEGKIKVDGAITNKFCFKIKLNKLLRETSVNNETVSIFDDRGVKCPCNISYNKEMREISVNPEYRVNDNKRYTLLLSENVKGIRGESFGKPISLSFSLNGLAVASANDVLSIDNGKSETFQDTTEESSKKRFLWLLLLLLLIPALYFGYTTVDGAGYTDGTRIEQSLTEVFDNYGWKLDVKARYTETTFEGVPINTAYYRLEKVNGKSDAYIVYIVNKNAKSSDIKFSVIDSAGKIVNEYVLPKVYFSELDTEVKMFSVDFKKRKIYAVNKLLRKDDGSYDFVNVE